MSLNPNQQVAKLKQALAEIRANREHFTETSFSQIVMLMLDKLRRVQTLTPEEIPTADEIRLVTVMFIDVKDSTEIVQLLDASDWKVIIDTAHEQIADIVAQWDGQIGQYLGDGVLCFFGAQRSRGDDAPHAVSCALQIQTVIETYAKSVKELHGIDFGIRIGISTGRVVVGLIGSQTVKQELLALGPATNLAARLQGVSPVGGVLVDSTTYNRIRRDYVTQAQPPVALRGFDKPVNNFRVLGRRTQPVTQFTDTQIAGIELPLVGRDDDLALISFICDRALQDRRGQVITVTGDIGMGKSRIMQETIHLTEGHFNHIIMASQYEARAQPYNLLWDMLTAQCHLAGTMSPEMMFQQIEAYIMDMWDHPDAPLAAQAIAYLAGFEVNEPEDEPVEWALRWFEGATDNTSMIITVDNLQWADDQSLQFLERLVIRLQGSSCVMIFAGRPEYRTIYPSFMTTVPQITQIELEALDPDSTLSIIQSVFSHVERVPSTLAYSINERVEGNPLFVHEYIGMLFDNSVFKMTPDGKWRFNIIMLDVALNTLPDGLLGVLQARLDDLPDNARQVMQVAAISGQQFWESSLATLIDMENISSWIEHLVMRGMAVPSNESIFGDEKQYQFRHSLYRDVAYEMIPRAKREEYHKQMSLWLLERIAGRSEYYTLLADQFTSCSEYLAALFTYLEAVEVQISKKQELKALTFIDRALSLANKVDRDAAVSVVAKLWAYRGEALVTLERFEEASAASQSSLMLLNELPKEQLVASRITAERILGLSYLSLGRYPEAYDALTRAHNLLPEKATGQIAAVLQALGKLYYRQGRLDESLAYHKRAYVTASKTQELEVIAESLVNLGMVDVERGNFAEALKLFDEALRMYRTLRLVPEQAHTLAQIGLVQLATLNYGKAYEYFSDAEYLNTTSGYANILVQGHRAFSLIMLGRHTQGRGLLVDAMANIPRDTDMQHRLQLTNITSSVILKDYAQARDQAFSFVQLEGVNPVLKARAYMWLGIASHKLGTSDAINHLRKSLEDSVAYGGRDVWLSHALLAQCVSNPDEKLAFYKQAAQLVESRARMLNDYLEMREGFIGNAYVQEILQYASTDQLLSQS